MKILIVDDSALLQERLKKALHDVTGELIIQGAGNCREAREQLARFSPDIVILDIALPDGSGINLLRELKQENPDLQVIIFTNYPTAEFNRNCIEIGADHFFDKSKDFRELVGWFGSVSRIGQPK